MPQLSHELDRTDRPGFRSISLAPPGHGGWFPPELRLQTLEEWLRNEGWHKRARRVQSPKI